MDLEFLQKSSKLKAQSMFIWFQAFPLGDSSILVPDHIGTLVSEGRLWDKGIEKVVGTKRTGGFLASGVSELLDFSQEPAKPGDGGMEK